MNRRRPIGRGSSARGSRSKPTKQTSEYDFDVALSFAGEDRRKAEALATYLKAAGHSVFYDRDHVSHLWGTSQDEWEQIYGPRSRYMIPFVSAHYVKKDKHWTRFEFESGLREEKRRGSKFILPVRVDNSRLLGLHDDRTYLSLNNYTIKEVADYFSDVCREAHRARSKRAKLPPKRPLAVVLDRSSQRVLGLVATSALPLTIEHYSKLFPKLNWPRTVGSLKRKGLLSTKGRLLEVRKRAAAIILADEEQLDELEKQWFDILEPLRDFKDMAPHLALHYLKRSRLDDAATLLSEIASGVDLGSWLGIYISALTSLGDRRLRRKLRPETQLRLHNALGICLTEQRRFDDALHHFRVLRAKSAHARSDYWLGQSYINAGVACFKSGDRTASLRWYVKAREHARKTGDIRLEGRALGNLAESTRDHAPHAARELLMESIALKRRARDREGLINAYIQLGNLEISFGSPERAMPYFQRAAAVSHKADYPYEQSLALHNLANSQRDCGQPARALHTFNRAYAIASELEYTDVQILASTGRGCSAFELSRHKEAEQAFRDLLRHARTVKDRESEICALHGIGILQMLQAKPTLGSRTVRCALRIATEVGNVEWATRCITDLCRPLRKRALGLPNIRTLAKAANRETEARRFGVAASIWSSVARFQISSGASPHSVAAAYEAAIGCLKDAPKSQFVLWTVLSEFQDWLWNSRRFNESLAVLKQAENLAKSSGLRAERMRCIDQRGVRLQELGRSAESVSLHRTAANLAKRHGDELMQEYSLNNLGEALRTIGRPNKAATPLREAEMIAIRRNDRESAISIAHNRALALKDAGDDVAAAKLFSRCRQEAGRRRIWSEYVRAWEALANLACYQSRPALARLRYRRAIEAARNHKVQQRLPRIVLNYARFLHWLGEADLALRELRRLESRFGGERDAHEYYMTLGQLQKDVGKLDDAIGSLEEGGRIASLMEDDETVRSCAAELAEIFEQKKNFVDSAGQLEQALAREQKPAGQAALLTRLFRVQLAAKHEKAAEKTFYKARQLAEEHGLHDCYIDLHMAVADHDWNGNHRAKRNALRAWIIAMIRAIELDAREHRNGTSESSVSGDVGGHIVRKMTHPRYALSDQQMDSLTNDVERWITSELGARGEIVRWVTWPLAMARKLLPFKESAKRTAEEVDRLVKSGELLPLCN